VLQVLSGGDGFSLIDQASGDWAYLAVFLLVFGDALCALFPGETTLNAGSTLASVIWTPPRGRVDGTGSGVVSSPPRHDCLTRTG
jgi:hypothetical protein